MHVRDTVATLHECVERGNFGTDLYVLEGLARALGGEHELLLVDGVAGVAAALAEHGARVAALVLTHVCYRTGRMLDMGRLTRLAHEQCAPALSCNSCCHGRGPSMQQYAGR